MTEGDRARRLLDLAERARAAEGWEAGELWRAYELVRDGGRDPEELIAEGIALSAMALELAEQV